MSNKNRGSVPSEFSHRLKLDAKERLAMRTLFPKQGNLLELAIMEDIEKKTMLSQADLVAVEYRAQLDAEGRTTGWLFNNDKLKDKAIDYSDAEMQFLQGQIAAFDQQKQLLPNSLTLCRKIQEVKLPREKK